MTVLRRCSKQLLGAARFKSSRRASPVAAWMISTNAIICIQPAARVCMSLRGL